MNELTASQSQRVIHTDISLFVFLCVRPSIPLTWTLGILVKADNFVSLAEPMGTHGVWETSGSGTVTWLLTPAPCFVDVQQYTTDRSVHTYNNTHPHRHIYGMLMSQLDRAWGFFVYKKGKGWQASRLGLWGTVISNGLRCSHTMA